MIQALFHNTDQLGYYLCSNPTPFNRGGMYCFMGRFGWISPMISGHIVTFMGPKMKSHSEELLVFKRS